jgi:GT2 family glycosyltransferase
MFKAFARSKAHRLRSRFSVDGNKARTQRKWTVAAEYYRKHLLLVPEDAAIWVQLGHMLKEAGQRQEARQAYTIALDLLPGDPDLLLHLGHALLAAGDFQLGMEYLRESAAAGNSHAAQDLLSLAGESITITESVVDLEAQGKSASSDLLKVLDSMAQDLRAVDCSDLEIIGDDKIRTLSHDPWVVFEWQDGACPAAPMAVLTIEARGLDADVDPVAQIYADIGQGFSERNSTRFSFANGKTLVLLTNPQQIMRLRFDPDQTKNILTLPRVAIAPITKMSEVERIVKLHANEDVDIDRLLELLSNGFAGDKKPRLSTHVLALDFDLGRSIDFGQDYDYWVTQNANPSVADYRRMKAIEAKFAIRPRFSFIMPTYNTPINLLRECIDSLLTQTYENFEVCIADDNSPNSEVVSTLEDYARRDPRVRFSARKHNGHISAASNTALSLAGGDYVVLVDHDDLIPDYTLFVLAWYVNRHPEADIMYSDEDKITASGQRVQPYFKSDFNQYLMYGHNMVSHLGVYRRALIEKVGGFRLGLEGSQDYDLLLRCFEASGAGKVVHIPHILYHWRIIPGSTAMSADQKSYAVTAAQNAINGHFERVGMPLRSIDGFAPGCTAVRPSRMFDTPVSIIIPTLNGREILQPCIESIFARDYADAEIIIVDNGSNEPETLAYLEELEKYDTVRIIKDPKEFNFSRINNMAVSEAKGEIICFLNNDTEVLSGDWLNRARAYLSMDDVGMVGARLLFPDGALQHFGIALGMGEHRVAGVPHLGMDASLPGYFGKARLLQEVSAVTAACLFVRKTDFEAVGGFEEELRVAYNDIDLCLKIRARGLKILADPDITLIHKESRTRGSDKHGDRARRLDEEAGWMRNRWANELDSDPYYSPNIDLGRVDFGYASKPRQAWPWEEDAAVIKDTVTLG